MCLFQQFSKSWFCIHICYRIHLTISCLKVFIIFKAHCHNEQTPFSTILIILYFILDLSDTYCVTCVVVAMHKLYQTVEKEYPEPIAGNVKGSKQKDTLLKITCLLLNATYSLQLKPIKCHLFNASYNIRFKPIKCHLFNATYISS